MGAGRRVFSPGEVLTASNTMNYLMDQSVMSFAGTAARGSAIGTAVSEGMVSYLADTNQVEVYDGSAWRTIAKTGASILQVVSSTYSVETTTSVSSLVATGLQATITPTSNTSKILVIVNQNGVGKNTGNTSADFYLLRGTSLISKFGYYAGLNGSTTQNWIGSVSTSYVDSPATTSAVTYKTSFSSIFAVAAVYAQVNSTVSTMVLMEIAG